MLVGLDIGTTGTKAVVFDDCGTVLSMAFEEYAILTGPNGKVEQDAEGVWQSAHTVLVRAIVSCGLKSVKAIGISVQGDAVIPIDRAGHALAPALLGMDYRSAKAAKSFASTFGDRELFDRTGMRPHAMNSITKILYYRELNPRVFEMSAAFVTYAEFIAMKLGGEMVLDTSMASRTMACHLTTTQWDDELLAYAGITQDRLGKIQPSGTIIGQLSSEIAREAGLTGTTMISTGGHDQCCAALGAGVLVPGMAVVSTGTAEVFSTCLDHAITNDGMYRSFFPCYRHVLENTYFTFSLNHIGGLLLSWFKETFCRKEIEEAQRLGMDIYHYLDQTMSQSPQNLFVVPHFNGSGTPWCDMKATGAIVGLTLSTGIPDLYRALLESQTYELALNLEAFQDSGIAIHTISAVGGGAKSSEWLQIKANILNRPIRVPVCRESAALGAAILAGRAIGLWPDVREGVDRMVGFRKEYIPNAEMVIVYAELLERYREIYPALKRIREEY
jgi:xylulokinase